MTERIVQIMPADGWKAVYVNGDGVVAVVPLVGWALVEDGEGRRHVDGLDGRGDVITLCDNMVGFQVFEAPGVSDWVDGDFVDVEFVNG